MSSFEKIAIDNRKSKRSAEECSVNGLGVSMRVTGDAADEKNNKLPVAIPMIPMITDAIDEFDCEIPSAKRLKEDSEMDAPHDTCATARELMQRNVGSGSDTVLTYDDLNYRPLPNDINTAVKKIVQEDGGKISEEIIVSKELSQPMVLGVTELSTLISIDGSSGLDECAPIAEIAIIQEALMIQPPDGHEIDESTNDRDLTPIPQSVDDSNQIDALATDHPDDCQLNDSRLVDHPNGDVGTHASATNILGGNDTKESITVLESAMQGQLRKSFNSLCDLPSQKSQDSPVTTTSKNQRFVFSFKTSISKMKGVLLRMLQNVVEMHRVLVENGTGISSFDCCDAANLRSLTKFNILLH